MRRPLVLGLTLAGALWFAATPGAAETDYEHWQPRSAATFLPPEVLRSKIHHVDDKVLSQGYLDHFTVFSDFGPFSAEGDAMLRRLVREIHALAAMREVTKTEAFTAAAETALKGPFAAMGHLVTHPVGTVSGVPKGIGHIFTSVSETVSGQESEYEDSEIEAALTVSKFKRQYARKLNIDVYTSNQAVQKELNRIGWASAIGNLAPGILTAPASAPAMMLLKGFKWVETFDEVLEQSPPGMLRERNQEALAKMGIESGLAGRFLDDKIFSPRHKTILVGSLAALKKAEGRAHLIEAALGAETEVEALFYQQVAETLAGYEREKAVILELIPWRNGVVARAANGSLVWPFPWTTRVGRGSRARS